VFVERKVEKQGAVVEIITLNRPKAYNALSDALFDGLIHATTAVDDDKDVGFLVLLRR
jgi:enoyl-CoA hydratase/carnithine racemase